MQQIQNIQGFILESKRLQRFDEVAALEQNLKELQTEYQRVQREKRELEQNYENFKTMFHKRSPMDGDDGVDDDDDDEEEQSPVNGGDKKVAEAALPADVADDYDSSGKNPFF